MRRAAVQVLRSARRPFYRSVYTRTRLAQRDRHLHVIQSSMYLRSFSYALVSGLVASGAYFAYQKNPSTNGTDSDFAANFSSAATRAPSRSSEATRKALVVEQGQLYTGTITGEGPLSKSTDDYGRKVLEMMTPEQATVRLRRNEESYLVGRGKGVVRYDVVQLASNDPIEDDHAEKIVEVPHSITPSASPDASPNDWMFWGVFDGHSGWTTSAKLRQLLISFVARELNTTYSSAQSASSQSPLPAPASIDAAIKRGFVALDTSIVQNSVTEVLKSASKAKAAQLLAPALSGSCALLSFYDSASKTLRVACTGDSRAILGRRSATDSSKWTATALSVDQTGGNAAEAARLRAEHPGEPDVVSAGRVLGGLEPSRAFGDATYKWSIDIQDRMKREYFGRSANPRIRTPPYVTAEPIVTTTQVQPDAGDFVVMATDGLWEMLTNEEVVGLVGQWLEKHPEAQQGRKPYSSAASASDQHSRSASWLQSWWSSKDKAANLPVQGVSGQDDEGGQRAPMRPKQWGLKPATNEANSAPSSSRFVVEDNNAATHLIRNALGGADRDMVCTLLTLPSPYSRRYRDDLTVEVIFFGSAEADNTTAAGALTGRIVINEEATAMDKQSDGEVKAKL